MTVLECESRRFSVVCMRAQLRGSKRTPTAPLCFRVSRVRHAEPRSDSRTHCRSKIARKTCVLQFVFSAPPLPTLQRRWQHPKSVGATASISYATGGSSGLLVHDLTPCRSASHAKGSGCRAPLPGQAALQFRGRKLCLASDRGVRSRGATSSSGPS